MKMGNATKDAIQFSDLFNFAFFSLIPLLICLYLLFDVYKKGKGRVTDQEENRLEKRTWLAGFGALLFAAPTVAWAVMVVKYFR